MKRSKVYKTQTVFGKTENDLLSNGWDDDFQWSKNTHDYICTQTEVGRPDRIASDVYGSQKYWWLLMKFNKIEDIWNDIKPALILKCPPKSEMDRYYLHAIRRSELSNG